MNNNYKISACIAVCTLFCGACSKSPVPNNNTVYHIKIEYPLGLLDQNLAHVTLKTSYRRTQPATLNNIINSRDSEDTYLYTDTLIRVNTRHGGISSSSFGDILLFGASIKY